MVTEDLLSVGQAAHELRCSPQTIRNYIQSGRLPAVRTAIGHLIAQEDVNRLIGKTNTRRGAKVAA